MLWVSLDLDCLRTAVSEERECPLFFWIIRVYLSLNWFMNELYIMTFELNGWGFSTIVCVYVVKITSVGYLRADKGREGKHVFTCWEYNKYFNFLVWGGVNIYLQPATRFGGESSQLQFPSLLSALEVHLQGMVSGQNREQATRARPEFEGGKPRGVLSGEVWGELSSFVFCWLCLAHISLFQNFQERLFLIRNPRIKLLDREGRREDIARLLAPKQTYQFRNSVWFTMGGLTWGYHDLMAFRPYSYKSHIVLNQSQINL